MTLPDERTRAVMSTRQFLTKLVRPPSAGGMAGVRREVREHARRLLRHYPLSFDLGRADAFDAKTAAEIVATEDDIP